MTAARPPAVVRVPAAVEVSFVLEGERGTVYALAGIPVRVALFCAPVNHVTQHECLGRTFFGWKLAGDNSVYLYCGGRSAAVANNDVCVWKTTSLVFYHLYLIHRWSKKVVFKVVYQLREAHAESTDNNVWPVSGSLPWKELNNYL